MAHCSLCSKGLPGSERHHQAEITVCKSCGTAVIALAAPVSTLPRPKSPSVKRYRRRSVFSRLWAFS